MVEYFVGYPAEELTADETGPVGPVSPGMSEQTPADEWREIGGGFTKVVEGVPDDASWNPSPPSEWAARDVVRHLVEWFPGSSSRARASAATGRPSTRTRSRRGAP